MPVCPNCNHTFTTTVIDLTQDADNQRDVLVLDTQQSNRPREGDSNDNPIDVTGDTVSTIPTREGGVRDSSLPRLLRIEIPEDDSSDEDTSQTRPHPFRSTPRFSRRSNYVLQERRWAPRRTMGIRYPLLGRWRTFRPRYNPTQN